MQYFYSAVLLLKLLPPQLQWHMMTDAQLESDSFHTPETRSWRWTRTRTELTCSGRGGRTGAGTAGRAGPAVAGTCSCLSPDPRTWSDEMLLYSQPHGASGHLLQNKVTLVFPFQEARVVCRRFVLECLNRDILWSLLMTNNINGLLQELVYSSFTNTEPETTLIEAWSSRFRCFYCEGKALQFRSFPLQTAINLINTRNQTADWFNSAREKKHQTLHVQKL